MEKKPYHHLPDGTFRNPEGSPTSRSSSGKFSYRDFNKEKKYTEVEGKTYAIGNFSEGIAGLFCAALVYIYVLEDEQLIFPVQIQTFIVFFCIPIAISLVEPSLNNKNKIEKGFSSILKVVRFSGGLFKLDIKSESKETNLFKVLSCL